MNGVSRFAGASAWRGMAAWGLALGAAASVALALRGASGALDFMRWRAAIALVGAVALVSLAAAVRGWRNRPALLMHLGFALVLGGWTANEVLQDLGVVPGEAQLRLCAEMGMTESTPDNRLAFTLESFEIDRWPDTGTVRQYTSRVRVAGEDFGISRETISVNHPLVKDGWWVYQSSYQEMTNPYTGQPFYFTILQCVRDAGLPFVLAGGILLLAGAFMYMLRRRPSIPQTPNSQTPNFKLPTSNFKLQTSNSKLLTLLYSLVFSGACAMLVHRAMATGHAPMQNMYEFLMCTAAFMPVLTWISARRGERTLLQDALLEVVVLVPVAFFMDGRVKHLMPALQSPFFVPHVGAYVLGYVLLVRAALGAGRNLVGAGFFLMTVGLVLGSAWGKVCWGNWWMFDPKEMWSLATWFVYVAYFHVRPRLSEKGDRMFLAVGAVMIVLTLTWINLSKVFTGMHSYA